MQSAMDQCAVEQWKATVCNRGRERACNGMACDGDPTGVLAASTRPNSCQRRPNRLPPDGVLTSMDGKWLKPPRCTHGRTDGTGGPAVGRGWRSPSRRFVNGTSAGRYAMGAPPTRRFQILNNKNVVTITASTSPTCNFGGLATPSVTLSIWWLDGPMLAPNSALRSQGRHESLGRLTSSTG